MKALAALGFGVLVQVNNVLVKNWAYDCSFCLRFYGIGAVSSISPLGELARSLIANAIRIVPHE